ncbi:MarR family winged helix-turn-helix transcriptional regulator [Nocardia sp. NPDC088792]|uniref:MarR family winged helix-turn-helix transcriptional regulator n=1 Tax=Nocardia sp. NPDC088792 TaxID=3364332 RepID=UPI00380D768A
MNGNTPEPIGYWLKHIDVTLESNFETLLATQELKRRHWQIMHTLAGGPIDAAGLKTALAPFLDAEDPTPAPYVAALIERGWVTVDEATAHTLTPEGIAAHADLFARIQVQRKAVTEGLSTDDYNNLLATLQRIADNVDAFALTLK